MRTIRYISLSIFVLGIILLVCPAYNIYAVDTEYNTNIVNSVSGEGTEQDFKDIYTETMLAQAIIDGGQVDFSSLDTPIAWIDFVDSITTPILQTIDDASPVDINLAGLNSRINECFVDYYTNGIVRNMNSSLSTPNAVGNVFSQMMRSKAQKSYIGGGGTSVGETLLQIAKDFYLMNPPEEPATYLPQDYLWFQNINHLYFQDKEFTSYEHGYHNYYYGMTNYPTNDITDYTYLILDTENVNGFGHLPYTGSNTSYITFSNYLPKFSIFYDTSSNTATYSASNYTDFFGSNYHSYRFWKYDNNSLVFYGTNWNQPTLRTEFESFDVALNYFYQHFYNIDFYVNGQLWVASQSNPNKFSFGGTTIDTGNNPVELSIPDFYSFDFGRFKDIIMDAINHSSVVMYEDIADCFLDINGQTCIATYSIVRNDYDDLVSEQFNMVSYPRFYSDLYTKNLVNQFRDDTEAGVKIIKKSYSIYPQTLTDALLYCGLLILFGLLIRRFLE